MSIKSNSRYGVRTNSIGSSIKKDVDGKIKGKARPTGGVMIPFKNQQQLTPYAPSWDFNIAEKYLTTEEIDCSKLAEFLLSKESEILAINDYEVNDCGTKVGKDSTTARYLYYNVLEWENEEISKLKKEIAEFHSQYFMRTMNAETYPSVSCRCWLNILRKGQRIHKHLHGVGPQAYLSGHFTVACDETKTIYVNPYEGASDEDLLRRVQNGEQFDMSNALYPAENVVGKMTMFPNFVPHLTTEHTSDQPRITLAFEITPFESLPGQKRPGETDLVRLYS